jgi:hypothetical protein
VQHSCISITSTEQERGKSSYTLWQVVPALLYSCINSCRKEASSRVRERERERVRERLLGGGGRDGWMVGACNAPPVTIRIILGCLLLFFV